MHAQHATWRVLRRTIKLEVSLDGEMRNWYVRAAGFLLLLTTAWYLPWALAHLNRAALWVSIPFGVASLLTAVMTIVTAINHWHLSVPEERLVLPGEEPEVLVIVPTCGEPPQMVYETARSVLRQDYPQNRIKVIISDDGHSERVRLLTHRLAGEFRLAEVVYHEPPRHGDPARLGDAKAGNLNSAYALAAQRMPNALFVETRDADDRVGDLRFLRKTIGQLLADPRIAFVQTIKDAVVSKGDPFGNREPLFYRQAMLARNAANAVFPCGSGLVWRRMALGDIGGFPSWNLVEDLQSGVEALRRGWRGLYLPIVGAVAQSSPEDLANAMKQRGTWALDTMRLAFWGPKRGLNWRQYLQFAEMGLFYLFSLALLSFAVVPAVSLALGVYPLVTHHAAYALHFWPYAISVELFLAALCRGLPYEDLWRSRQIWFGMAPVYAKATVQALLCGPYRKPSYQVTRKESRRGWYWSKALPQIILFLVLLAASVWHVATHSLLLTADLGSLFWAGLFMLKLSRITRNSWYGAELPPALARAISHLRGRATSALPAEGTQSPDRRVR
jgi:cellulose synthase (UDP-forming)